MESNCSGSCNDIGNKSDFARRILSPVIMQQLSDRFRKFLPVIVDVETGGFNEKTDALLEVAAIRIEMNDDGMLVPGAQFADHILPFEGARCEEAALKVNGIQDPYHPLRKARPEKEVLNDLFELVGQWTEEQQCTRAILVGHNAFFDHKFLFEAARRCGIEQPPFHSFSTLDTVTVGACVYGETVLSKVAIAAGIKWEDNRAHSAIYDAEATALIFCHACNQSTPQSTPQSR